jgi:hypothetical protein
MAKFPNPIMIPSCKLLIVVSLDSGIIYDRGFGGWTIGLSFGMVSNHRCEQGFLISFESSYVPGYLKELQDGHREELQLFKSQLIEVREQMVRISKI